MNIHKLTTEKWQSVTIISVMETQTQICPFRGSVLYITCIIIVNIIIQKSYTNLTRNAILHVTKQRNLLVREEGLSHDFVAFDIMFHIVVSLLFPAFCVI